MAVRKVGEKYRCNICGNEITVTKAVCGTPACCGEYMEKLDLPPKKESSYSVSIKLD